MTTALQNIRDRAAREALANREQERRRHLIGGSSALPVEYHGPIAGEEES